MRASEEDAAEMDWRKWLEDQGVKLVPAKPAGKGLDALRLDWPELWPDSEACQSLSILRIALTEQEQRVGPESPDLAYFLNPLGHLLISQGQDREAEEHYRRSWDLLASNPAHPAYMQTLLGMAKSALTFERYPEAERLARQAVTLHEEAPDGSDPPLFDCLIVLARLCNLIGRYEEARDIAERILRREQVTLTAKRAETLQVLAEAHCFLKRFREAMETAKASLRIWEETLGTDHFKITGPLYTLATVAQKQRRYTEAREILIRIQKISERALGKDHPGMARVLNDLSLLEAEEGHHVVAEALQRRILFLYEASSEAEQSGYAIALHNLSWTLQHQKRYAEAETSSRCSLALLERILGIDHPLVAKNRSNLAHLLYLQGRHAEAETLALQGLEIHDRALGTDHPDAMTFRSRLADIYRAQGRQDLAEPLLRQVLRQKEQRLGPAHKDLAIPLLNLGTVLAERKKKREAKIVLERSLALFLRDHPDHPSVAVVQSRLARLRPFPWIDFWPLW